MLQHVIFFIGTALVLDITYTLNFGSFLLIIQNKYSKIIFFNSLKNSVKENQDCRLQLKGHGNEADFLGFLQKLVPHRSLTLPFEPFDFGFKFAEIFVIEKRLPDSACQGVDDSPTRRDGESALECLKEN